MTSSNNVDTVTSIQPLGFIVVRHMQTINHQRLWKLCYDRIRMFYPSVPIMIIDDNSNPDMIDPTVEKTLVNTQIINSQYPQRGELLAYYYFHKLHPFEKAIFLHDSMFLTQPLDETAIQNVNSVKFLWHFYNNIQSSEYEHVIIRELSQSSQISALYTDRTRWYGCFGVASIITWSFIDLLHREHNIFTVGLKLINTRLRRENLERVFAVLCTFYNSTLEHSPSLLGNYNTLPGVFSIAPTFDQMIKMPWEQQCKYPIFKIFNGR
jgi:hypothetical protein